jgi:hypothetical protein
MERKEFHERFTYLAIIVNNQEHFNPHLLVPSRKVRKGHAAPEPA